MSVLLLDASMVLEVGIRRGWPSLSLCWHSKGSGEKFHMGFLLGAELGRKTQREARRQGGRRAFQV